MSRLQFLRNRRPLLLLFSVTVLIGSVFYGAYGWVEHGLRYYRDFETQRTEHIIDFAQLGDILVRNREIGTLKARLQDSLERGNIDYFRLESGDGELTLFESDPLQLREHMVFPSEDRMLKREGMIYLRSTLEKHRLTTGIYSTPGAYLVRLLKEQGSVILRDILIVVLMGTTVLAFFMNDILQLLKTLRASRGTLKGIAARSTEGEALLKAVSTLDQGLEDLEQQNEQLRNQVLSALNSELMSGRTPPYDFECTLVRVDVNNFTHIFSNHPIEEFMAVINEFFGQVTEIVSRYRGYIYEFVGDEVIFYFKDEDHPHSAVTALSALRDINVAATAMDEKTREEKGYSFKVKSSLAHGKLRFGPQVNGFSLAGAVLIETVRILSQIDEKEENVIYFDEDIASRTSFLCLSQPRKVALLKGFHRERRLHAYVSHVSLENVLRNLSAETADLLSFYRSDDHLVQILHELRKGAQRIDPEMFLAIARPLRTYRVPKTSWAVQDAYRILLQTLISRCEANDAGESDMFRLSSTLSLAQNLLDAPTFAKSFQDTFKRCLDFQDRRVVANSLDVLAHFSSGDDDSVFRQLLRHQDNRIVANALVKEGLRGLNRTIVRRIGQMISSQEPRFVASALYVIGELALHHRTYNAVHYETNNAFRALVSRIGHLVDHQDPMIRRQALIAGRKSEESAIRRVVHELYSRTTSVQLKADIEAHYLKENKPQESTRSGDQKRRLRVA